MFPEAFRIPIQISVWATLTGALGHAQKVLQENPGVSLRIEGVMADGRPGVVWSQGE